MTDHANATKVAAKAFLGEDYDTALRVLAEVLPSTTIVNLQLVVIGLQRLGEADRVQQFEHEYYASLEKYPWEQALIDITLAKKTTEQVFLLAEDDQQRCQAHYYAAHRHLTEGDFDAALSELKACVSLRVEAAERTLALLTLRILEENRAYLEPRYTVRALLYRAKYLEMMGDLAAASEAAMEAVALAERAVDRRDGFLMQSLISVTSQFAAITAERWRRSKCSCRSRARRR